MKVHNACLDTASFSKVGLGDGLPEKAEAFTDDKKYVNRKKAARPD